MADFQDIQALLRSEVTLSNAEILELISDLKGRLQAKNGLTAEQDALLTKCREHRSEALCCPHCGSVAIRKNGTRKGRQRYFCKDCNRTFGDTYGTIFYYSKLSAEQWEKFIDLTLRNQSLNTIGTDMHLSKVTTWFNRHKLCSAIMQAEKEQDSFRAIVEGDEYYQPLSFLGCRDTEFFINQLHRLPRHNRSTREWEEYFEKRQIEHDIPDTGEKHSAQKACKEFNALPYEEKRKRGISNEQVCILTCIDLENRTYIAPTCNGRISPRHLEEHLKDRFEPNTILVSDSHRAYKTFANKCKIPLRQVPPGKHSTGVYNLSKVSGYHSQLTTFMTYYKEVASKYIDH